MLFREQDTNTRQAGPEVKLGVSKASLLTLEFGHFPKAGVLVESGLRPEGPRELSPEFTLGNAF
jgi:hypothetical protein